MDALLAGWKTKTLNLAGIAYSLCLTVLGSFSFVPPTCFLLGACVWHSMVLFLKARSDRTIYIRSRRIE